MTRDDIRKAVEEAQEPLVERVEKIARQRTLLLVVTLLALLTAGVSVLYGINREDAFQNQLDVNQAVVCAAAKSTALAPRKQPIAGESRAHYLNRLESQREQLLAVGDLHCPSLPGFATFPYLRAHAIAEIEAILKRLAPKKLREALERDHHISTVAPATPNSVAANSLPSTSTPADAGGNEGGTGSSGGGASPGGPSPPHHPTSPQHEPPQHHPPPSGGGGGNGGGSEPAPGSEAPAGGGNEGGGEGGGGDEGGNGGGEAAKPGVVGNPGGILGEVVCSTNKLGLPVCAE